MSILSRLYRLIDPDHQPAQLDVTTEANIFLLRIGDVVIGHLSTEENRWKFEYSDEFRSSDRYSRIIGFSDLNKTYYSDELWPFFRLRIPGLKQPLVREIMERERIDSSNEVALLKRFGLKSISNPYMLEPV